MFLKLIKLVIIYIYNIIHLLRLLINKYILNNRNCFTYISITFLLLFYDLLFIFYTHKVPYIPIYLSNAPCFLNYIIQKMNRYFLVSGNRLEKDIFWFICVILGCSGWFSPYLLVTWLVILIHHPLLIRIQRLWLQLHCCYLHYCAQLECTSICLVKLKLVLKYALLWPLLSTQRYSAALREY